MSRARVAIGLRLCFGSCWRASVVGAFVRCCGANGLTSKKVVVMKIILGILFFILFVGEALGEKHKL